MTIAKAICYSTVLRFSAGEMDDFKVNIGDTARFGSEPILICYNIGLYH